jgi:hypothetical protein
MNVSAAPVIRQTLLVKRQQKRGMTPNHSLSFSLSLDLDPTRHQIREELAGSYIGSPRGSGSLATRMCLGV